MVTMLRAVRVAALTLVLVSCTHLIWWAARSPLADLHGWAVAGRPPPGGWTLDRLVVDVASATCAALGLLVTASAALTVLSAYVSATAPCLRFARVIGPRCWRQFVLVSCGLGMAIPASALAGDATGDHHMKPCESACSVGLAGLPLPDLPNVPTSPRRSAVPSQPWSRAVIVQPGDSLWLISQSQLISGASDAVVAKKVDYLYAVNRNTIGNNPDLIYPGQLLNSFGGLHD
ncbi:MAG: LysM domain-containing protein [Nocardioidaceae bacterium]